MSRGFSNWKDATVGFRKHERSICHIEAVQVVVTLPATTRDVGELLSQQFATQKVNNRDALYQIFKCIRFLCRQGLALRGCGDEFDGNLRQLLYHKVEDDANLESWLKRKENVYCSPDIQNEVIKVMGLQILRDTTIFLQLIFTVSYNNG